LRVWRGREERVLEGQDLEEKIEKSFKFFERVIVDTYD